MSRRKFMGVRVFNVDGCVKFGLDECPGCMVLTTARGCARVWFSKLYVSELSPSGEKTRKGSTNIFANR